MPDVCLMHTTLYDQMKYIAIREEYPNGGIVFVVTRNPLILNGRFLYYVGYPERELRYTSLSKARATYRRWIREAIKR